jgi:hypothetical protein
LDVNPGLRPGLDPAVRQLPGCRPNQETSRLFWLLAPTLPGHSRDFSSPGSGTASSSQGTYHLPPTTYHTYHPGSVSKRRPELSLAFVALHSPGLPQRVAAFTARWTTPIRPPRTLVTAAAPNGRGSLWHASLAATARSSVTAQSRHARSVRNDPSLGSPVSIRWSPRQPNSSANKSTCFSPYRPRICCVSLSRPKTFFLGRLWLMMQLDHVDT